MPSKDESTSRDQDKAPTPTPASTSARKAADSEPERKDATVAPNTDAKDGEQTEEQARYMGTGPTPGASSVPGGKTEGVYMRVGTQPIKVDTSLANMPDGVKVGQYVGVDPNHISAPASHIFMPLVEDDEKKK